jgi:energy-coupling factor transporter ATP-binding protein EcfA2
MRARDNPFRTERLLSVRYRFHDFTQEEVLARLARCRYRGAIVGPEGSGKTTLLEELAAALADAGMPVHLSRADRGPLPAMDGRIILLDAVERLSVADWLLLRYRARLAAGLVITARHAGRLPTIARLATTPSLLAGIASDLQGAPFPIESAERLYRVYDGNLRAALLHLYDECGSA